MVVVELAMIILNHVSVCFEVYRSEIVLHDNDGVHHLLDSFELPSLLYQ